MFRSIEKLIQLEGLEKAKVVAGFRGLNRVVKTATLMEVPDIIPYVEEGSLLITTMYPIADDDTAINTLIPRLYEKKVAGICIKPLRYISEIPVAMIDQANALGFPILELDSSANLSSIVNTILSAALNDHVEQIQFRDSVHNKIMELLVSGASIDSLVLGLTNILQQDVYLLSNRNELISGATINEGEAALLIRNSYVGEQALSMIFSNTDHVVAPIRSQNHSFGSLHIPNISKADHSIQIATEQAAMLFATAFFRNDMAVLQKKNYQEVFLRELIEGKSISENEFDEKCNAFDVELVFPLKVTAIRLFSENDIRKQQFYNTILDMNLYRMESNELRAYQSHSYTLYHKDCFIVVEPSADDKEMRSRHQSQMDVIAPLITSDEHIGIGISQDVSSYREISVAFEQAVSMTNIGNVINGESFIETYDDNRLIELVSEIEDVDILKRFVDYKLGKIIAYDNETGYNLLDTLRILIRNNFNFKRAAEDSFVHYNTIRYRAAKLNQLGVEFEPGQSLSETILAYNIYLWIKANKNL